MKVRVTKRAALGRNHIMRYIQQNFGDNAVTKFRDDYKKAKLAIGNSADSFPKDWDLSDDNIIVRFYIINGLTKVAYVIENEQVVIVDMWDTRHEPPRSISID